MVQLDLDNVYLKITGLIKEQEIKLWNELSFGIQIYGVPEIRYRHLFNRKTKKTYAGLFDYVKDFFDTNEIDYKLNDNRVKPEQNANFKLVDYIDSDKKVPLKLRPYQQDIVDKCREREVIQACTGAGKCLPLDTDILTPNGFVKMRDIHVGSIVYDENGEKTNVIAEFPQDELKQEYKITFNDGSYVICCKDHLWKYDVKSNLQHHRWKVNNIVDILHKYGLKKNRSFNIYIPVCKPIQFSKKDLFIPPYLMGALLGDGGLTQNTLTFTNVEQDIIDKVNLLVSKWGVFKHRKNKEHIQLHFVGGKNNPFKEYLTNTFHHANSSNKFIPQEYKMSSIEDRFELVRGLIDTDGSVNEKGHIKIGFVSEQLAKDLQFVLQSLGYRAKLTTEKRDGRNNTYDLYIRCCDDKLFSSKKHKERFNHRKIGKNHHYDILKIVSVEQLNKKSEMKCITVDSPLHTYICKDFIVTHNTLMMAACIAKFNVKPVCIFADKIGLCMQLKQEMEKFLGVEVGLVGDGVEDYKDITVISIQSADDNYIKDAKMCLWDECLPYDTEILLENRTCMKIGDIVKQKQMVNVWTYNVYTHQFEVKPIIDFGVTDIGTKKILKLNIKRNDGKNIVLHCTDNHKVFIKNKNDYVRADCLNVGDKVIVGTVETLILKQYEGTIDNIEVDDSNAENYVYDLTVADNHNFIANGVLVSNCHHIPAQTITTIANKCKNAYYRIGVSATPWRDAGDDLLIEAVLNKKKDAVINASMLIEMGYLVKPEIYFVPIKQVFKGKNYQDIYNKAIVENLDRNKIITKIAYNMYIRDKHILMLYKNIKHGEKLLDMVSKRIGEKVKPFTIKNPKTNKDVTVRVRNVELLSGNDDTVKRLAVFEAVKAGFCRCLIASTIADEGLDLPILDTLILAGGGKSSTRAFQRIGRVIRLHEGKTKGVVFDFTDYTPMLRRHSRNRQKYYEQEPLWDIHKFNVNPD